MAVVGHGMLVRRVSVAPSDVVFVKGILEASDGIAALFAESGGELSIVAPHDREAELAMLLDDLTRDVDARLDAPEGDPGGNSPPRGEAAHV